MASRVYVIELGPAAGRRRDPRIPWVYVGSSARTPEIRFDQHRRGYRSSGIVKRFALHLRPDLYEDVPAYRGSRSAQRGEEERARELAAAGFVAHCDGTSHGSEGGFWEEWGPERLEPVAARVDEAARELLDSAFSVPSPSECAALLRGERGFWADDFIDRADPPPAYGMFAHVRLDALEHRIEALGPPQPPARAPASRAAIAAASRAAPSGA